MSSITLHGRCTGRHAYIFLFWWLSLLRPSCYLPNTWFLVFRITVFRCISTYLNPNLSANSALCAGTEISCWCCVGRYLGTYSVCPYNAQALVTFSESSTYLCFLVLRLKKEKLKCTLPSCFDDFLYLRENQHSINLLGFDVVNLFSSHFHYLIQNYVIFGEG